MQTNGYFDIKAIIEIAILILKKRKFDDGLDNAKL